MEGLPAVVVACHRGVQRAECLGLGHNGWTGVLQRVKDYMAKLHVKSWVVEVEQIQRVLAGMYWLQRSASKRMAARRP